MAVAEPSAVLFNRFAVRINTNNSINEVRNVHLIIEKSVFQSIAPILFRPYGTYDSGACSCYKYQIPNGINTMFYLEMN